MLRQFSLKLQRDVFSARAPANSNKKLGSDADGLGYTCGRTKENGGCAFRVGADASASELSVYPRHPQVFFDPPLDQHSLDMPALLARTAKFAPLSNGEHSDSDEGSIQNSPVVDTGEFMTGPLTGSAPPHAPSWGPELESARVSSGPSSLNTNRPLDESSQSSTEALQTTANLQFSEPEKPYSMFMGSSMYEAGDELGSLPQQSGRSSFRRSSPPKLRELDHEDDDILPFAATKQMASQGVRRGSSGAPLPTISPSITMTMDRYQTYRKSLSSLDMLQRDDSFKQPRPKNGHGEDDEEDGDEADGLIASDEKERKREVARRRQQQDAQLSVYRQQMTKVIGNGKPGISSSPSITLDHTTTFDTVDGDDDDDDELDDVPLAALRSLTMPQRRGMPRARSALSIRSEMVSEAPLAPSSSSMLGGIRGGHARQKSVEELPPLPKVFGTEEKRVSRGLVAAIAKEEDAKARRKSMPVLSAGGVGGPDTDGQIADLQQQLHQLAEMQFQLFSQVNGGAGPPPPMPHGLASQRASTIFGSGMPHSARPASIRSFGGAPAYQFGQRQSLDLGRAPYSPQSYSSNERLDPLHGVPQTPPSGRLSPMTETRVQNRPSMMRIVMSPEDGDDDDDDDDEAWQKMLQERRALRAEWARSSG